MKQIKVPTPRQLPSGNWFLQISVKGKRISVTEPTEKACVARAIAIKSEMLEPVSRAAMPTLSACIDRYIEDRKEVLSPATIRGYRNVQRQRFKAAMDRPINAIDRDGWQRIVNQEARIVSAKTVTNSWGFVSSVIHVETGKRFELSKPQIIIEPREYLSPTQIVDFLEAIRGNRYEIPALLALHSLRRSEILAMDWSKINLKGAQMKVQGAVVPDEDGNMVKKKENKNQTSRRTVPIMIPRLLEILGEQKAAGKPVIEFKGCAMLNGVNRVCRKAGLPEVGLHGLRHSFASLAYSIGMPPKVAQKIGGWKDDQTMLKIYTHIADQDIDKYTGAMRAFYENTNETTNGKPQTL